MGPVAIKYMVYHTCSGCGKSDYYDCYDGEAPEPKIVQVDNEYKAFVSIIKDKIISLQGQLLKSYEGKVTVDAQDKLRFSAMIEVLEAMLY